MVRSRHVVIHDMLASVHFGTRLGCVLLLNQIFLKTMYRSTIYHIHISDQSALQIRVRIRVSIYHGE